MMVDTVVVLTVVELAVEIVEVVVKVLAVGKKNREYMENNMEADMDMVGNMVDAGVLVEEFHKVVESKADKMVEDK